jgi:glycogen synthase
MTPKAEVKIIELEDNGSELFDEASQALFKLERYLRKREQDSTVCMPIYKMRNGISQLKEFFEVGETVCDKRTRYDEYTEVV